MIDNSDKTVLTPLYLDCPTRRLFSIYHAPSEHNRKGWTFIYVPPFAEEMNNARRVAALGARALAARGIGVLVLDLFGTGDSGGDFRDARWELWLDDVSVAVDWLERQGGASIGLWGLRLGGLIAAMAITRQPQRFKHLLLWQPVIDGKSMLTQFLRIRVAAAMGNEIAAETTEGLRAELAAGGTVEVAGYELSSELAQSLMDVRLNRVELPHDIQVHWFEVGPHSRNELTPAAGRIVEAWRARGVTVTTRSIAGEPFWAIPESPPAPELVAETAKSIEACSLP